MTTITAHPTLADWAGIEEIRKGLLGGHFYALCHCCDYVGDLRLDMEVAALDAERHNADVEARAI